MQNKAGCIAFVNPKGGSGKTTSCLSIAGYMVKSTYKVFASDQVVVPLEPSGFFLEALENPAIFAEKRMRKSPR
jgi:cellulose biosynthesis protein BcsQ